MSKEVITAEIIRVFLRSHLLNLTGAELVTLRGDISTSSSVEDLPSELCESLRLKNYRLIKGNTHKVILEQFDSLIRERCFLPGLLSEAQINWVTSFLEDAETRSPPDDNARMYDIPEVVVNYAKYLHTKFETSWQTGSNISAKRGNSGKIQILVDAPVIRLSTLKPKLEEWLEIFEHQSKEVLIMADQVLLVDASLTNILWHGVNIYIWTKKLECINNQIWDLSGREYFENGGNIVAICIEFVGIDNLSIITNGGTSGGSGDTENYTNILLSSFPPSATSGSLRELVAENALALGGIRTRLLCDPIAAIDPQKKVVVGKITEFYIEGELHNGFKYFVGFYKGTITTNGSSFCLIQNNDTSLISAKEGTGAGGIVVMASTENLHKPIIHSEIGIKVTSNGEVVEEKRNYGQDIGYVQLNDKKLIKYPRGEYEVVLEDTKGENNVFCQLVGKWISIRKRIKLQTSPLKVSSNTKSESSPQELLNSVVSQYKHFTKRIQVIDISGHYLWPTKHSDWWIQSILQQH